MYQSRSSKAHPLRAPGGPNAPPPPPSSLHATHESRRLQGREGPPEGAAAGGGGRRRGVTLAGRRTAYKRRGARCSVLSPRWRGAAAPEALGTAAVGRGRPPLLRNPTVVPAAPGPVDVTVTAHGPEPEELPAGLPSQGEPSARYKPARPGQAAQGEAHRFRARSLTSRPELKSSRTLDRRSHPRRPGSKLSVLYLDDALPTPPRRGEKSRWGRKLFFNVSRMSFRN
ncbi:uncharacterized protein LOC123953082 [Meles meles]|uniref:uncharacterized protein LOC123953082 n=1 Tax=Meles meles TaxID=9662 RepID=UPI001E699E43|nr:uncharacterized protein LOC123953082 [Meles meles]